LNSTNNVGVISSKEGIVLLDAKQYSKDKEKYELN
jgi:hypothetical protein